LNRKDGADCHRRSHFVALEAAKNYCRGQRASNNQSPDLTGIFGQKYLKMTVLAWVY
jgi:hypothetical protein